MKNGDPECQTNFPICLSYIHYVHVYKNEQGGFCPGGDPSYLFKRWIPFLALTPLNSARSSQTFLNDGTLHDDVNLTLQ